METWQSDPVATPGSWQNDPVTQPPKIPDMSDVQKTAQDNIVTNDNKESPEGSVQKPQTPVQRLDTAGGMPISSVLSGNASPTDVSPAMRGHYVNALKDGSAVDGADFMQSVVRAIAPVASRDAGLADYAGKVEVGAEAARKGFAGLLAYPYLSDASKQKLLEGGVFGAPLTDYKDPEAPTTTERVNRGLELEQATVGNAMGAIYAPIAAPLAPLLSPAIEATPELAKKVGIPNEWAQMIPKAIGAGMDVAGGFGLFHAARNVPSAPVNTSHWDNVPNIDTIKAAVSDAVKKPPEAVTPQDIDQTIARGSKDIMPPGKDFKNVSVVMGGDKEAILHTIYKETGVKPDQVFADTKNNPNVAADVVLGKVPDAYSHLITPKEITPEDALSVARSDTDKAFNVVDKDGDYVQGGFDSAEEARHYIEDKKNIIPDEPPEWKSQPVAGSQAFIDTPEFKTQFEGSKVLDKSGAPLRVYHGGVGDIKVLRPMGEANLGAGEVVYFTSDTEKAKAYASKAESLTGTAATYPAYLNIKNPKIIEDVSFWQKIRDIGKPYSQSQKKAKSRETAFFPKAKVDELRTQGYDGVINNSNKEFIVFFPEQIIPAFGNKKIASPLVDKTQKPIKSEVIPPSEIGKPTSLRSFLSNNGAKFNEDNELVSIKKNGTKVSGEKALEHANEIAKEQGYLPKDDPHTPSAGVRGLQDLLSEKGGREAWREADQSRVLKAQEAKKAKENLDPAKIEHEAYNAGIDTSKVKGESDKQRASRLLRSVREFYAAQEGSSPINATRKTIGDTILATEKFTGKLTGDLFQKLATGYIKTFQPELAGPLAKRADAFMAKYKASLQEAENAWYRKTNEQIGRWDKQSSESRMQWLYDHETGRWNEEENPDHARYQALLDATFDAEKKAIGADAEAGYKENYLPHQWENPDAVKNYFQSEAYIRKYGKDGFTKRSAFQLIQDGIRAGFKLKTDNPERMLVSRLLAGQSMIRTMDLLKDLESSGVAKPARAFSIDKRIAKTQEVIADAKAKYKAASDKINDPQQLKWDFADPAVSAYIKDIEVRLGNYNTRLEALNKEKEANKLTPEQMTGLKGGFRIIGPDSKVWNIHQQASPLWKNAMEMKGLWENQGVVGDAYRAYTAGKAIWTAVKLGLSLFHPVHVAMIHLASDIAATSEHLIRGGSFSDIALKDTSLRMGLTGNTFKAQDHPAVVAWKTPDETRTPEQRQIVKTMIEGGFNPIMSARDTIHFKENFDKAIKGVGLNNLRLLGTAVQLPGKAMAPFFEHWIPGLKSEMYLKRAKDAISRDQSLLGDSGRRGETLRQIAKDTDRTYGEMNNDVHFWNRNVRDAFNASFISGGWKLAQIYNARGLLQPLKTAYNFAKTGEFSKEDITYNMLHAYAYTGLTLALGGAINAMLGNPIGAAKDTVWDMVKNLVAPQTGEKNPDGTPIRLNQPAFAKEAYSMAHEINTKGLMAGSVAFLYHQTLIPGIVDTLNNRDFTGRELISDPLDLHQWANAGWNTISPISVTQYEKAESKNSEVGKVAGLLGFPTAGAYLNQTPFEQKILYIYSEQNPPKGDAYSSKLKADLKSEIAHGNNRDAAKTTQRMKEEGMTSAQISAATRTYSQPFVKHAWQSLTAQQQKNLWSAASDEEKKEYILKK